MADEQNTTGKSSSDFTPDEFDHVCMADGKIYQGPDTGDTIPNPQAVGWWNGHPVDHSICPEHEKQESDPYRKFDVWAGLL